MVADSAVDPHGIVTRVLRENVVLFIHRAGSWLLVRLGRLARLYWRRHGHERGWHLACLPYILDSGGDDPRDTSSPALPPRHAVFIISLGRGASVTPARKTIGNNLSLASGPERDARALELTPGHVATWAPRDGTLAVTNHFQDPALGEPQERAGWLFPNSTSRLERLHQLLPSAPSTLDAAQAILMDTTPVRPDLGEWDCLANPGTIYSTVFDPVNLQISLRVYDRPDREFKTIDLADRGAAALSDYEFEGVTPPGEPTVLVQCRPT